jgi:hypothetical protein
MAPGQARVTTIDRHLQASGLTAPVMTAFFGDAATEHMSRYGTVRPSRSSPRSQ